jgi:hypothetical protein
MEEVAAVAEPDLVLVAQQVPGPRLAPLLDLPVLLQAAEQAVSKALVGVDIVSVGAAMVVPAAALEVTVLLELQVLLPAEQAGVVAVQPVLLSLATAT